MKSAFVAAFIFISGVAAHADTVNIDFSFDNTYYTGSSFPSGIAGTVSGEIFGLTEGGSSSASEVVITSVPAGSGLFTGVYNLADVSDSFTLTNTGVVISAYFIDYGPGLLGINTNDGFAYLQSSNTCNADQTGCAVDTVSFPGYGTLTFSLAPTVTPLPASWALMLGGLAGIGFIAYRRNAKAAFTAA